MDRYSQHDHIASRVDPETALQAIEAAVEAAEMTDPGVGVTFRWDSGIEWHKDTDLSVLADARRRLKHSERPDATDVSARMAPLMGEPPSVRVTIWAGSVSTMLATSGSDGMVAQRAREAALRRLNAATAAEPTTAEPTTAEPTTAEATTAEATTAERKGWLAAIEAHPAVTALAGVLIGAAALLITKLA